MKSYYGFIYCVFFIQRIHACDTKVGRPKKVAGRFPDPKKWKFCEANEN